MNLMAASPEDQIIIRPAMNTKHDRVVDVLNAAAAAEVKKLTFS
jgi:biopolymer transport protein ExbD